jgi:hypothetical protein
MQKVVQDMAGERIIRRRRLRQIGIHAAARMEQEWLET